MGQLNPRDNKTKISLSTFSSLHHINYRYLWIGSLFNAAGLWIQQVTVSWLVWELSGSAAMVGIASGLRFLPFIFMGPLGGIAADRLDRRRLLMASQSMMAAAAVIFAVVVALDWVQVWHALLFSFVMGCGFIMNIPVRQTLIANTVPLEDLGNAIALSAMVANASRIIGPAVGGILIVAFGAASNFLLQAGLYLCMVAVIFPMKIPYRDVGAARKLSALASMKEGLQYVWGNKMIFGLVLLSFMPSMFVLPVLQILPAFTAEVLYSKADMYGYLMAAFGIGGFLATLAMASFGSMIRSGRLGILSLLSAALFVILFSRAADQRISMLLIGAIGFCHMTFRVNNNTMVQTLAPDALRGRVMAIYESDHAFIPFAYTLMGVCADIFSTPTAIAGSGIIGLVVMVTLIVSVKQIRDLRKL